MTRKVGTRRTRIFVTTACVLLLTGAAAWWQWTPLMVWYHLRGLTRASDSECATWVGPIVARQDTMLPHLLRCLQHDDQQACTNVGVALARIVATWIPEDPRRTEFAARLAHSFPNLSTRGRRAVLAMAPELLGSAAVVPPELAGQVGRLVTVSAAQDDADVRAAALRLAVELVDRAPGPEVFAACRIVAQRNLHHEQSEVRVQAIRLAQTAGMQLLDGIVPLLDDSAPEVRRAAMLAVGTARDAIAEDDLLRWLHDPDVELQKLCEQALRSRGLRDQHLKLGRLLTDGRPGTRLQVLEQLQRTDDLEPGVWLRRLSHDPAPAVRAAAVRAAAEHPFVELSDRLEQMAENDPSPTVRELARFYLRSPR